MADLDVSNAAQAASVNSDRTSAVRDGWSGRTITKQSRHIQTLDHSRSVADANQAEDGLISENSDQWTAEQQGYSVMSVPLDEGRRNELCHRAILVV